MLTDRPAFVRQVDFMLQTYDLCGYTLQIDFEHLSASIIKLIKGGEAMNEEIKYTILADDGNNISYEKAILSKNETSRDRVAICRERIESIKAHIIEENEEIAKLEKEIVELENIIAIADEKKALENQVANEQILAENINNQG